MKIYVMSKSKLGGGWHKDLTAKNRPRPNRLNHTSKTSLLFFTTNDNAFFAFFAFFNALCSTFCRAKNISPQTIFCKIITSTYSQAKSCKIRFYTPLRAFNLAYLLSKSIFVLSFVLFCVPACLFVFLCKIYF